MMKKLTLLNIVGIILGIILGLVMLLYVGISNNELKKQEETIQIQEETIKEFTEQIPLFEEYKDKVKFYETNTLRTGYILYISGNTLLVYDDIDNKMIQFYIGSNQAGLIHCDIEVGDKALYMTYYKGFYNATLLGIIKE